MATSSYINDYLASAEKLLDDQKKLTGRRKRESEENKKRMTSGTMTGDERSMIQRGNRIVQMLRKRGDTENLGRVSNMVFRLSNRLRRR